MSVVSYVTRRTKFLSRLAASRNYLDQSLKWNTRAQSTENQALRYQDNSTENNLNNDIHVEDSEVQEQRNVSRLPPKYYEQYHGRAPEVPYKDIRKMKERYARFGAESGEDARILWPTRTQILSLEQNEQEDGMPLTDRLANLRAEQEAKEKAILERRKMIEKNMQQMPKWIAEYHKKQEVLNKEAQSRAEKKEALLEEARDYFGYRIKANDPKFQQMVEEKEEREKKEARKRKREEKMKKQADRLAAEIQKVSQMTRTKMENQS